MIEGCVAEPLEYVTVIEATRQSPPLLASLVKIISEASPDQEMLAVPAPVSVPVFTVVPFALPYFSLSEVKARAVMLPTVDEMVMVLPLVNL